MAAPILQTRNLLLAAGVLAAGTAGYVLWRRRQAAVATPTSEETTSTPPASLPALSRVDVLPETPIFDRPGSEPGAVRLSLVGSTGRIVDLLNDQGAWVQIRNPVVMRVRKPDGTFAASREGWVDRGRVRPASTGPSPSPVLRRARCNPPTPVGQAAPGPSDTCPMFTAPDQAASTVPLLFRGMDVAVIGDQPSGWRHVRWTTSEGREATSWVPAAYLAEELSVTPTPSTGPSPFGGTATGHLLDRPVAVGRCRLPFARVLSDDLRGTFTMTEGAPLFIAATAPDGRAMLADPHDRARGNLPFVILPNGLRGWTTLDAVEVLS